VEACILKNYACRDLSGGSPGICIMLHHKLAFISVLLTRCRGIEATEQKRPIFPSRTFAAATVRNVKPAVDARIGVKRDCPRGCGKGGRASCSAGCWHGPEAVATSKLPGAKDAIPNKG